MKKSFVLSIALIAISSIALGQQPPAVVVIPQLQKVELQKTVNKNPDGRSEQKNNPGIQNQQSPENPLLKARLSHQTNRGKVYIIPLDGMACLVPDKKMIYQMPKPRILLRQVPIPQMPNAIPETRIIPQQ